MDADIAALTAPGTAAFTAAGVAAFTGARTAVMHAVSVIGCKCQSQLLALCGMTD